MPSSALHLIAPSQSGWPALAALRAIIDNQSRYAHTVVLIGSAKDERLAHDWGIRTADRIAAPLTKPQLAWTALRRYARARGKPAIVHAWGAPCAELAHRAKLECPFTVTLDGAAIETFGAGALMRRSVRAAAAVHYTSEVVQSLWAPFVNTRQAHTVAPLPVDPRFLLQGQRATIRARYPIDDETNLIFAAGEPPSSIDARYLAYAAGLLAISGVKCAIHLPPDAAELERALRWTQQHNDRWHIITDTIPPHHALSACDLAVWSRGRWPSLGSRLGGHRHTATESLSWAAAAGIPIIAERQPESEAALHHLPGPTLLDLARPLDLPVAMLKFIDNPAPARTAASTLREQVLAQRDPRAFARAIQQLFVVAPLAPALSA